MNSRSIYFTTKEFGFQLEVVDNAVFCLRKDELCSNQEEADTKIFLAAKFAEDIGCSRITIFTVDSDVVILACYYASKLQSQLFLHIGSGNNIRILDVGENELSEELLDSLPSLHALSGCDAVSAFNGIGKSKWLLKVEKNNKFLYALKNLGDSIDVNESEFATIESLVCHLYGFPNETDVNIVRYKKFCNTKTPEPHLLPPTKDELFQHVKRANYQTFIWKRAMLVNPETPAPNGNGWNENDGQLEVVWMEQQPAPLSLLELVVCDCKRAKCLTDCQCRVLLMECTELCKCKGSCDNVNYDNIDESDDENDEAIRDNAIPDDELENMSDDEVDAVFAD